MGAGRPLRVVQWSTGNIGRRSLRNIIEHPDMRLVGVLVHSSDKAGQDAGELCGLPGTTGVKATTSVEEILALDADCVIYMRQGLDYDEVAAILASGKNIVTTRGEFHDVSAIDPVERAKIEQACRDGQTSIYSTGSSPGFISEALTLPVISCQRRLDCLTINEYSNMSRRDSPHMIFEHLGYGKSPEDFDAPHMEHLREMFSGTLNQIANAIGQPIDEFTVGCEVALANKDTTIVAGSLKAGTVAAQRITVSGRRGGRPFLQFRANWYLTKDVDHDWDLLDTGWRVVCEGDAPMDIRIAFPVAIEDYTATMPGYTAHRTVNAIPTVCAAPPGIRTTVDLPQVIARF